MSDDLLPLKRIDAKFDELRKKEAEMLAAEHSKRVPLSVEACDLLQNKFFRDLKTWKTLYTTHYKEAATQRAFWEHMHDETKITYEAYAAAGRHGKY